MKGADLDGILSLSTIKDKTTNTIYGDTFKVSGEVILNLIKICITNNAYSDQMTATLTTKLIMEGRI
ncbi:hypothetical protein TS65_31345 [Aneurinibacillus migulanus]|uniref:Uncharacterized protein n=1 Tax=Aneurinibacillus migulanus TaxID=47500 RepID=A0A0D1X5I3_ANEMI|nr:hypothetical protein TS65_31345 [Aneurinibacillus migulanus]KON97189.1 hypothetical protein AF333_18695 [Aneurinibacillus migulanus]SDK20053.1 hypothetical protein SAMN04487909_14316 [Aneurinibacillus migulanus]